MKIPTKAQGFSERLLACRADELPGFAETEILTGLPFIFGSEHDLDRFQEYVATALGVPTAAQDVLIIGSAKTGFSLDPDRYFVPFRPASDIDVAVVHTELFDEAWRTMLSWDYLTNRSRGQLEQRWLCQRQSEVWSGWYNPRGWSLRERGGLELLFPTELKPLREFSYRWFSAFRSLSRYKHHPEIPRHEVSARLYRTRDYLAMYQASGLRVLRAKLTAAPTTTG